MENDLSKKIIHHNKLVRDNIPDIIRKNGKTPYVSILDNNDDYVAALYNKLSEETNELKNAKSEEAIINETADVLEVIYSILDFYNISLETMEAIRKEKLAKNGGFNDKIFLEYTK